MTCRSIGFHHLHKRLPQLLSQRCLDAAPPTSRGGFVQNLHRNWAWLILIKQCKSVSFAVVVKLDATSAFRQPMSLNAIACLKEYTYGQRYPSVERLNNAHNSIIACWADPGESKRDRYLTGSSSRLSSAWNPRFSSAETTFKEKEPSPIVEKRNWY